MDVEFDEGFAETGGFGDADVARDVGVKELVREMAADFFDDLGGEAGAGIVHGHYESEELELGIEIFADEVNGLGEKGESFEREVFALDGHDDEIGGGEGIEGEDAERRRAVNQDVVELVADGGWVVERMAQDVFAFGDIGELDFGPGEGGRGGREH